jgi:hypothetical protein
LYQRLDFLDGHFSGDYKPLGIETPFGRFEPQKEGFYMADWYPNSRDEQLHMVKTWNTVFATQGPAWGIPQEHISQLVNDDQAVETILDKVKSGERTAADVVQCNMIFKDMETEVRFIKKHHLLMSPLTLADFPLLLLPAG